MSTTHSPAAAPGEGSPGRHGDDRLGAFEERLLAELTAVVAEQAAALADPAPPARQRRNGHGLTPGRAGLPRRRGRAAAAVIAVALTAALATGLAVAGVTGTGPATPAPGRISLDAFLGRAAAAARTQPTTLPGPGQIFYVKVLDDTTGVLPGPATLSCQVNWDPAPSVGGTAGGDGTSIPTRPAPQFCASGVPAPPAGYPEPWFTDHGYPSWDHNGYPPPDTLPTGPAALRAALYAAAGRPAPDGEWNFWGVALGPVPGRPSQTDIVFELVGRLLQAPISSPLRSALYEVTAQLPGVMLIPDVADAAGRHGVQIALATKKAVIGYSPGSCVSGVGFHGFILDPVTYRFLGERTVTKWTPMASCPPALKRWPLSSKVITKLPTKAATAKAVAKAAAMPVVQNTFSSGGTRSLSGTAFDVTAVLQAGFIDATRR